LLVGTCGLQVEEVVDAVKCSIAAELQNYKVDLRILIIHISTFYLKFIDSVDISIVYEYSLLLLFIVFMVYTNGGNRLETNEWKQRRIM